MELEQISKIKTKNRKLFTAPQEIWPKSCYLMVVLIAFAIFRPQQISSVDAVYCYSSVVCMSVCCITTVSPTKTDEPIKVHTQTMLHLKQ